MASRASSRLDCLTGSANNSHGYVEKHPLPISVYTTRPTRRVLVFHYGATIAAGTRMVEKGLVVGILAGFALVSRGSKAP